MRKRQKLAFLALIYFSVALSNAEISFCDRKGFCHRNKKGSLGHVTNRKKLNIAENRTVCNNKKNPAYGRQ